MKILILSAYPERIADTITEAGDEYLAAKEIIEHEYLSQSSFDFAVSYGYRHILGKEILNFFGPRIINLHLSLLPWNRGAHPNFWSIFDNTPAGVSIHIIDQGLDTGPLLAQREIRFDFGKETLATSYGRLQFEMETLFQESWTKLRNEAVTPWQQTGSGSFHRSIEMESLRSQLPRGWDTPVSEVVEMGRKSRDL